jgi:rSAM/selenodomain-associated transferase 2
LRGLTVVIPTLDAGRRLADTLAALAPGMSRGAAVLVVDGGSHDDTVEHARRSGARVVVADRGRGPQLVAGGAAALDVTATAWLLFLHADTTLDHGWPDVVARALAEPDSSARAAVFTFALDDVSPQARRLTAMVDWRVRRLGLPYGDQGLLIHRDLYTALGGYRALPLMEDVDIVRRIGRRRLTVLPVRAITSADRWRREGWWRRSTRNVACLVLYYLGVPPRLIRKVYG